MDVNKKRPKRQKGEIIMNKNINSNKDTKQVTLKKRILESLIKGCEVLASMDANWNGKMYGRY